MRGVFYRLAERGLLNGQKPGPNTWLRPYATRNSPLENDYANPEAHGLSLVKSLDDFTNARKAVPRLRKKSVAEVNITEADGLLKHTPSNFVGQSHHDWWTEPFDLLPNAVVVEEGRE